MTSATRDTVVAVFADRESAELALADLRKAGFTPEQLGIAVRAEPAEPPATEPPPGDASRMSRGAGVGMLIGASMAGLLAAAGAAPLMLGGALAVMLPGAVAGTLLGALIGLGVSEEHARYYEGEVGEGRVLVTVKAGPRREEARELLLRAGGWEADGR